MAEEAVRRKPRKKNSAPEDSKTKPVKKRKVENNETKEAKKFNEIKEPVATRRSTRKSLRLNPMLSSSVSNRHSSEHENQFRLALIQLIPDVLIDIVLSYYGLIGTCVREWSKWGKDQDIGKAYDFDVKNDEVVVVTRRGDLVFWDLDGKWLRSWKPETQPYNVKFIKEKLLCAELSGVIRLFDREGKHEFACNQTEWFGGDIQMYVAEYREEIYRLPWNLGGGFVIYDTKNLSELRKIRALHGRLVAICTDDVENELYVLREIDRVVRVLNPVTGELIREWNHNEKIKKIRDLLICEDVVLILLVDGVSIYTKDGQELDKWAWDSATFQGYRFSYYNGLLYVLDQKPGKIQVFR